MSEERQVYAAYDNEGIFVYQAFKSSIIETVLKDGTLEVVVSKWIV